MEPDKAKTMGGIGSILTVLGTLLIGYILVLAGMRGLGNYYGDEDVKRNSLWWFIWAFAGGIAAIAAFYVAAFSWPFFSFSTSISSSSAASFAGIAAGIIAALLIVEIFSVLSARHLKRVYAALSARSGERLFNTAAKLYWWGSLLIIVLVGFILIWISWIISAVAFLSMKSGAAAPPV